MKKIYFAITIVFVLALSVGVWYWKSVNSVKDEIVQQSQDDLVWYQVPELGVEFQVKKPVADELAYMYQSYPPQNIPFGSALFSIKSLSSSNPLCKAGGAMIMHRFDGVPGDYEAGMITGNKIKQFDGFFVKLSGPVCSSDEDYRRWAILFTGEDSQVEGWMVDDVLKTLQKTSRQPSAPENLSEISQDKEDLVWYQVPELGIEFQTKKSVADELMYIYQAHPGVEFGGVSFSAKKLSLIPGCDASSGSLGTLTKLKGQPSDYEEAVYYLARNPRQFNGFFVVWNGPQAVCASPEYRDEFEDFFKENQFNGGSVDMIESIREIN